MTKTCTKCQTQFETDKEEQVLCPTCLAAESVVEGQAPVDNPAVNTEPQAPVTEGVETTATSEAPTAPVTE